MVVLPDAIVSLPVTMLDLPETMVHHPDTVVDIPYTMVDLAQTMTLGSLFFLDFFFGLLLEMVGYGGKLNYHD